MTQIRPNVDYGPAQMAAENTILRTEVGSGLHGMAIAGTDDHDEMGVYIEPPEYVMGVGSLAYFEETGERYRDHHIFRTQPEGVRSGPGDVDRNMYSLHKYVRLALAGNPTILLPLFAPREKVYEVTELGHSLRALAPSLLSVRTAERFLGYLIEQRKRMLGGGKQNRVPKRPELVAAHGYDTKYASHALRLAYQGQEIALEGRLTLPMSGWTLERCMEVKRGEVGLPEALRRIDLARVVLEMAISHKETCLPERPDYERVSNWMVWAQQQHWADKERERWPLTRVPQTD